MVASIILFIYVAELFLFLFLLWAQMSNLIQLGLIWRRVTKLHFVTEMIIIISTDE